MMRTIVSLVLFWAIVLKETNEPIGAMGRVMEKCGFVPTGETCIDANQYQGANRPIRVLRLEFNK